MTTAKDLTKVRTIGAAPGNLYAQQLLELGLDPVMRVFSPSNRLIWNIAGPTAPTPGAEEGLTMVEWAGGDAPFDLVDLQGAREDGVSNQDRVMGAAELDFVFELSAAPGSDTRRVMRWWTETWAGNRVGRLNYWTPEMGDWWMWVRKHKPIANRFKASYSQTGALNLPWALRGDKAFWISYDSVSTFTQTNSIQTLKFNVIDAALGVIGGTFKVKLGDQVTAAINFDAPLATVQAAIQALSNVGTGNAIVTGQPGKFYTVTFVGALTGVPMPLFVDDNSLLDNAILDVFQVKAGGSSTGYCPLVQRGTETAFARFLLYGPADKFTIGDGTTGRTVTFGPVYDGQVFLISTEPRLPTVLDVTPTNAVVPGQKLDEAQKLLQHIINLVTNNNVPPLLEELESIFGIQPPQGNPLGLLKNRFSVGIRGLEETEAPFVTQIPVQIDGGTAGKTKIVAALTPKRTWPE